MADGAVSRKPCFAVPLGDARDAEMENFTLRDIFSNKLLILMEKTLPWYHFYLKAPTNFNLDYFNTTII